MVHDSSYVMTTELEYSSSVVMTRKVSRSGANPEVCKGGPMFSHPTTQSIIFSHLILYNYMAAGNSKFTSAVPQLEALH